MKVQNKIAIKTRQAITDEMELFGLSYHGLLNEPTFLNRIFNLKELPCSPEESRYDNAYDDIYQHTVNNPGDYHDDWIYTDPRINLLQIDDESYLKFLSETLHPRVRPDAIQAAQLLEIYNRNLSNNGFEIAQTDLLSGKPIFSGGERSLGHGTLGAKKIEIKKYLDTAYVNGKVTLMNEAVNKDTDLAIGTAKELIETACKSILKQKRVAHDPDWTLPKLFKETISRLNFKPKNAADPIKAETSIKRMLQGMSSVIQGVAEVRNEYGTGHGKDAGFKGLETQYAKFIVGSIAEILILLLAVNGEQTELDEPISTLSVTP